MPRRFGGRSGLDENGETLGLPARTSVGEDVYEALLTQLITLKIAPGDRISVDALVRELGVSQTPIRAALIRLETEGVVLRKHNAGFSAAPIPSGKRFNNLYEFRMLVEPAATAMATERMTESEAAELTQAGREMEDCLTDKSNAGYGRFAILDARFHEIISQSCGNDMVGEALGRLYTHMQLFRLRQHTVVTEEAVKEHSRVLTAMTARDAEGAAAAMRDHIARSRARMEPFYRFRK